MYLTQVAADSRDTQIDGVTATQILWSSPLSCTDSLLWFGEESLDWSFWTDTYICGHMIACLCVCDSDYLYLCLCAVVQNFNKKKTFNKL